MNDPRKQRQRLPEASWPALLAALALPLAVPAHAQSPEPAPMPTTAGSAAPATPADGAAAPAPGAPADGAKSPRSSAPPQPVDVTVVPTYTTQELSGSRSSYYHYNRQPTGLYFGLLHALRRDSEGYPLQEIWWRNPGMSDEKGYLDAHLRNQPTFLRFWRDTADFIADPRLSGRPFSRRENTRAEVRVEKQGLHPTLDLYLWDQKLDEPAIGRYLPFRAANYQATTVGFTGTLPVAGGLLSIEPRHLTFDNHIGRLPGSDTTWLSADFQHAIGDRVNASLGYDRISTGFAGRDSADWNVVRFQGNARASDSLYLDAFFRHQDASLPFTRTDYADQRDLYGLNLNAYPFRHGSLRGGLFREEIGRVENPEGNHESAAWTGGWFDFRTSNPGVWTCNLRFREKDLTRAPEADIPGLPLTDTLYYQHDHAFDGRFDFFPTPRVNSYFSYGWRERDNGARATRLTLNTATLGATASLSPRLNLSAEYTAQLWDGNTRPFQVGGFPPPGNLPPRLFYSDGQIAAVTASYQLTPASSLELSFNHFQSTGGQAAQDYLASLEYRRNVSRSFFYSVGYQFESFRDGRLKQGYTAVPLLLQLGFRHEFR